MGSSRMEEHFERHTATGGPQIDPSFGPDELWGLFASGETSRLDGVEWLLDWIETRRENPR